MSVEWIEEWRDVAGWNGRYAVSSFGRVRTNARSGSRGVQVGGSVHRPMTDRKGYLYVFLSSHGKRKRCAVHRLVVMAFIGNQPDRDRRWVNHKDGVKTNNTPSNLEWCSPSENNHHAWSSGLQRMTDGRRENVSRGHRRSEKANVASARTGKSRRSLSTEQVESVRELLSQGKSQRAIANQFGVCQAVISCIYRGTSYQD